MSPEWLTAIGTLGTFVVIAASAIAALMQLRHMRGGNQIVALTEVRETLESSEFQAALRFVDSDLQMAMQDSKARARLIAPGSFPVEFEPIRMVANFFESTGTLIKRGIIDRDIACDLWGYVVLRNWELLAEFIANARTARGGLPMLWENFEYWAVLSKNWLETHPNGDYPAGVTRMPPQNIWTENVS